jgi:hypothetical protein
MNNIYRYRLGWKINGSWKYKRIRDKIELMVEISSIVGEAESISVNRIRECFRLQ